ncbi:asparagine synthase (glutamine-hydrolyzing) [Prosthecobacter sp.]|uniref:asparagine synthase (glutamine-hydrolyzing) n=1 Tax=Prosthecobacter sp. TaxID=1965333 RepID=UPI00378374D2
MCGIAAIYHSQPDTLRPRLQAALSAMKHRGPDGSGIWLSDDAAIGLGSVRLAVMGLADGRQPLSNESGTIHAVVNGEFYDFERLRSGLESRGHVFATHSDSELLVHLYEEHGLDCLRHLRGEFAFLLWDEPNRRLIAARDRFGIKPLHFIQQGGEWLFASEVKALLAAGVAPRWDESALLHSLAHQYLRPRETLFASVRQIPPAHLLVLHENGARESCYWQPSFEPDATITPADVRAAFEEAVHLRLRSDVPVACALSGGLDSTAVAALTAQRGPVDCFCVRFDAPGYDEGPQVRADALPQFRIHEVAVSRQDLVTHLPAAVHQSEGLAINGQLVGKQLLARAIHAAGFKVVLAGEGADEAFLGYSHLQQDHTGTAAAFALQRGVMLPAEGEAEEHWRSPSWLPALPTFLRAKLATGRHFAALTREPFDSQHILDGTLAEMDQTQALPARQSAWLWARMSLAQYILRTLGDGTEMGHSIEARLPFLDHVLFELAARIPAQALLSADSSKIMLREALRGLVPEAVRLRPKHPFLAPPLSHDPQTRDFVQDTLHSTACRNLPLLDHRAVLDWSAHLETLPEPERTRLDPVLMQLLTATLLHQTYHMT